MFGFFKAIPRAIGRGFKAVFWDIFKSQMAKFVMKYEATFRQVIIDVAMGQLEGDRSKQQEAFARMLLALKGVPGGFKDLWVNWGIETILFQLKKEGKVD